MTIQELRHLICSVLQVEEKGLGDAEISQSILQTWDSLRHLNIIMALERETGKKFAAKQISIMVSLAAIAQEIGIPRPARPERGRGDKNHS